MQAQATVWYHLLQLVDVDNCATRTHQHVYYVHHALWHAQKKLQWEFLSCCELTVYINSTAQKKMVTGQNGPATWTRDLRSITEFQPCDPPILVVILYPPIALMYITIIQYIYATNSAEPSADSSVSWRVTSSRVTILRFVRNLCIFCSLHPRSTWAAPAQYCHVHSLAHSSSSIHMHTLETSLVCTVYSNCIMKVLWLSQANTIWVIFRQEKQTIEMH